MTSLPPMMMLPEVGGLMRAIAVSSVDLPAHGASNQQRADSDQTQKNLQRCFQSPLARDRQGSQRQGVSLVFNGPGNLELVIAPSQAILTVSLA